MRGVTPWVLPMTPRAPRHPAARTVAAVATLVALPLAGCGSSSDDYANEERPPSPIVVTAFIGERGVSVSPAEIGAGPIDLIVTNQTMASRKVTLETAGMAGGIKQDAGPINPRDTARIKVDVKSGDYRLKVSGPSLTPAALRVGPRRPSAQNDLLQP